MRDQESFTVNNSHKIFETFLREGKIACKSQKFRPKKSKNQKDHNQHNQNQSKFIIFKLNHNIKPGKKRNNDNFLHSRVNSSGYLYD